MQSAHLIPDWWSVWSAGVIGRCDSLQCWYWWHWYDSPFLFNICLKFIWLSLRFLNFPTKPKPGLILPVFHGHLQPHTTGPVFTCSQYTVHAYENACSPFVFSNSRPIRPLAQHHCCRLLWTTLSMWAYLHDLEDLSEQWVLRYFVQPWRLFPHQMSQKIKAL